MINNGSIPFQVTILACSGCGGGGGGEGQYHNCEPGLGGGVKFFKFIANFQIGIGYQILGGCLNF